MKKNYILSFLLALLFFKANAQPATPATPPPVRNAANVISIYSGAYTNVGGTDFNPNWGQAGFGAATEITVSGDQIRSYPSMNYQGVQFGSSQNLSSMDSLHLDIWSPNCSSIDIYLIRPGGGSGNERFVNRALTTNAWNSINIKLTDYVSQSSFTINDITQFKFVTATPTSGANIFIDNMYFYTNVNLPTLSNFSVAAQTVGVAPFALTAPTSNSAGAFTYSSSNTNVATISGNMVTVVGAGTSVITATQAANGAYSQGTITASLVATYAPPTVAATNPTTNAANVISLYSNAYTNVTGINWNPNWGQSTQASEVLVAGNSTRKYELMNYQGIELATPLDVSTMNFLHLDIWTPNITELKIFLINLTPAPTKEFYYTFIPNNVGWNSLNIPLNSLTPVTPATTINLAAIGQMKFEGQPWERGTAYMDNIYYWKTTLPVSLLDFKAVKNANSINLNWKTATESNNKGFAVERSTNATNWAEISFVNGFGNSTAVKEYTATDNTPSKGINYYRLKQVDNDGKQTYSPIISLKFEDGKGLDFAFYPNPVKNKLTVTVDKIETATASLNVVSVDGKLVKSVMLNTQNSNSSFLIDVTSLTKGMYYLVLTDGIATKSSKFVVE
jgi:hypothetical protein